MGNAAASTSPADAAEPRSFCFAPRERSVSRWTSDLSVREAAYAERLGLTDLLGGLLKRLAQAESDDAAELLLLLAAEAAEELRGRQTQATSSRRSPQEQTQTLKELLDRLCKDLDCARAAARRLLFKHDLYGLSGDETLICWSKLAAMLRSLEVSWGCDRQDTQLMLRLLKREAFQLSTAKPCRQQQEGLSSEQFVELWPGTLSKVRRRYRSYDVARVGRKSFLRKASWQNVQDCYQVTAEIGSGAAGTVALCVHKLSGNLRALKSLTRRNLSSELDASELLREFEVLTVLDHPNIMRVFEVFEDGEAVHIAMEPVMGGNLRDAALAAGIYTESKPPQSGFQETWIAEAFKQILDAVWYANRKGVVHKDLKPANVLVTADPAGKLPHVVVCDFGLSEVAEAGTNVAALRFKQVGGTPFYMAPEVWHGDFSVKADVWSIGVMLYELLSGGKLPFTAPNMMALCWDITSPSSSKHADFSLIFLEDGRDFCRLLLEKDEMKRIGTEEAHESCISWLGSTQKNSETDDPGASCTLHRPPSEDQTYWRDLAQNLGRRSTLDKCVMTCIGSQLNATKLSYLNETFQRWDLNHDGVLTQGEMRQAVVALGLPEAQADAIVKMLDTNGDGRIEYSEFVAGCMDLQRDQVMQNLRVAFSIFDLDGSGFLDLRELEELLNPLESGSTSEVGLVKGLLPDGATLEEVLEELDSSKDGRVSFEEFQAYILRSMSD